MTPPRAPRMRLDVALVDRGLASTRARAQALVMAGKVEVAGVRVDKPGTQVAGDTEIRLTGQEASYVSRGGDKLAGAIASFEPVGLDVRGKRAADFGASTGGFTDCLLQRGCAHVFAIDVGYGLLHEKLRNDPRVTVLERTNAREVTVETLGGAVDLVVVDASFIGLGKLIEAFRRVLGADGELVALIKPQFEAGRREVSRGRGVIRDEQVRAQAIESVVQQLREAGFEILADAECVLPGPKGNREHFVYARIGSSMEPRA
ncbi:MAG: TlyA family RNA methyltransferase [Deltaproteobacteria bacterium]|nr:TlyA family RNA methyltransferase [Deltaproteobacteria bacterium]